MVEQNPISIVGIQEFPRNQTFSKKVEIRGCAVGSFPVIYIERATKYAARSLGSAGEHRLHTAGVTGSNPVATTTNDKAGIKWFRPFSFKGVEVSMPVEVATCFKRDKGAFRESERHRVDRACSSTVEQGTHNPLVLGSNPGGPTKHLRPGDCPPGLFFCIFQVLGSGAVRW